MTANITESAEIIAAFDKFQPDPNGAYLTGRVLLGQAEQEHCQEWEERGTIDGASAQVIYIFDNDECESEDPADYPFDSAHIQRIEIDR